MGLSLLKALVRHICLANDHEFKPYIRYCKNDICSYGLILTCKPIKSYLRPREVKESHSLQSYIHFFVSRVQILDQVLQKKDMPI